MRSEKHPKLPCLPLKCEPHDPLMSSVCVSPEPRLSTNLSNRGSTQRARWKWFTCSVKSLKSLGVKQSRKAHWTIKKKCFLLLHFHTEQREENAAVTVAMSRESEEKTYNLRKFCFETKNKANKQMLVY